MSNVNFKAEGSRITVFFEGHIDSANAPQVEQEVNQAKNSGAFTDATLDCEKLEYISSAGLRIILRLRKDIPTLRLINVAPEVYEILDTTGFTEMMEVQKAYRVISVDGCEVIGQGANGKVYRIDRDTIVKVYLNPDSLPDIQREREIARKAFVMGIPTAIPYDVVRVGESFGSVFELLNAKSFAKLLTNDPSSLDEVVRMSVELLKKIHSTELKPGDMPDMKAIVLGWVEFLRDHLPAGQYEKLHRLVADVPQDNHMIHGDYHIKNVMLQNGEALLIDMDTLCMGYPVFEFASIYNAYAGFSDLNHENVRRFLGISYETANEIWEKTLRLYFDTDDEKRLREIEDKAMLIGFTRIMRRSIRRNGFNTEAGRAEIENCRRRLAELLPRVDTLTF